jgi:hypothetical protein
LIKFAFLAFTIFSYSIFVMKRYKEKSHDAFPRIFRAVKCKICEVSMKCFAHLWTAMLRRCLYDNNNNRKGEKYTLK